MNTYIVQMDCLPGKAPEVMQQAGLHIKWMKENIAKGFFIAAGPYISPQGNFDDGLCIMQVKSETELKAILEEDPFYKMKIRNFKYRQWDYHVDQNGYRIIFPEELVKLWDL